MSYDEFMVHTYSHHLPEDGCVYCAPETPPVTFTKTTSIERFPGDLDPPWTVIDRLKLS